MTEKYRYGKHSAEVEDASGVSGVLIRELGGEVIFRVYNSDKTFVDYDLLHDDLPVVILEKSLSSFYSFESKKVLDHSPEVLGLKEVKSND